MKSTRALCILLSLAGISAAFAATPDRLAGPLERRSTLALRGHQRPWALPKNEVGALPATQVVPGMTLAIQPTDAQKADLQQFLHELQDKSSPNYHKFLTPEQFADRFGASSNDLAKVKVWLESFGLTVDAVGRGRTFVKFHGTAGQVNSAFQTELRNYNVEGKTLFANASAPRIPAQLFGMVQAIRGLHSLRMQPLARRQARPEATRGNTHTLAPGDLATIYNFAPLQAQGINGTGQTIAVVGATDLSSTGSTTNILPDLASYRSTYGLPVTTVQQILFGPDPGADSNAQFEAALDLQVASAVAPNATLIYVNDLDTEDGISQAIDNVVAPIITSSYADANFGAANPCNAADIAVDALYQQAMAQYANALGITWINAAGDSGAAGCDASDSTSASMGRSVSLPAAVPEVTAIGGTTFREGGTSYWNSTNGANGGSAKSYIPEIAWNETAVNKGLFGTGGGASVIFAKPFWQTGPGVPNDGARDVPDISFSAALYNDPYEVCFEGCGNYVAGGTSAGAPLFAGMVALLNQYAGLTNGAGNVNPALYQLAQTSPSVFHDVTLGDNVVPCAAGSPDCVNGYFGYSAGVGYDLATGLGSIDANQLLTNWGANVSAVSTSTTISAGTGTVSLSSNLLLTVTVKAATGTATPTGTVTFRVGSNNNDGDYWLYLGTATLSGSGGTATATFNFYPNQTVNYYNGGIPVTAVYSGDANFRASGTTVTVGLQNPPAKNSAVVPFVSPQAVSPVTPDADGYKYFFQIYLGEVNGNSTTVTDLKIDGVSFASQLLSIFGGTTVPAGGQLVGNIRWNPPTAPYSTVIEVSGKDASGATWTQQTPLIVTARQLAGNLYLTSDPTTVYGNSSNSSCPWSEQLQIYETGGREVYLQNLFAGNSDVSSQIQQLFGTMRVAPLGSASAKICWNSNPGSIQWELFGADDLNNPVFAFFTSTYGATLRNPASFSVSPSQVTLSIPSSGQSASSAINISLGNSSISWHAYIYPYNKTTQWLTAYPQSGTGSGALTLIANGAGFAPGVYYAKLVISADGTSSHPQPGFYSIPVVMQIGQTGSVSISGVTNAASYAQGYAPGALVAVFGSNLAGSSASAASIPLPTSLAGVSATVNGVPAPLWFISPGQINLQIPYETGAGTAVIGINNNGSVGYTTIQMSPAVPGIFSANGLLNPDSTAKVGTAAYLFLTGDGDVTPALATGASPSLGTPISSLPSPFFAVNNSLTVTVGGINAPVLFAGVTPGSVGVTQVNFQLPSGLTGTQPVVVTVNGVSSSPVNINITN